MEKRLSKRKSQSGCIWGLIGMFGFPQGGSADKLLADGRHFNRHAVGGHSRNRFNWPTEKCHSIDDVANYKSLTVHDNGKSVKKFIQKDKVTKQHVKKQAMVIKLRHVKFASGLFAHIKKTNKARQAYQRVYQKPIYRRKNTINMAYKRPSPPTSVELSSNKLNLAAMLEAFYNHLHQESERRYSDVQTQAEKEKAKPFPDAQFKETGIINTLNFEDSVKSLKLQKQSTMNFLKNIKARYGNLSKGGDDHYPSNKVVVLKPDLKGEQSPEHKTCSCSYLSPHNIGNKGQSLRHSYFSFTDIKRKLKDVIGQNRYDHRRISEASLINESVQNRLNFSEKKEFDICLKAKRHVSERLNFSEKKEFDIYLEAKRHISERLNFSEKKECDIYLEAKIHISERLNNVDEGGTFSSKQAPRTLLKILSSPEYDLFAKLSSKRDREQLQNIDSKPSSPEILFRDTARNDSTSNNYMKIVEANEVLQPENLYLSELPSEPNSPFFASSSKSTEKIEDTKCSRLDTKCSSPSSNHKVEGHPSPVSVLEQNFMEDVTSPTSTILQPAELSMQSLKIDFEEHSQTLTLPIPQINLSNTSLEDNIYISNYIKAVLQASDLNLYELYTMWDSSEQLLDQSLFDELDFLPNNGSCCGHRLLFDCINEVASKICHRYCGCSPWLSFLEPKIGPISLEENVVQEVMEGLDWHNLPVTMPPRTLEQIVRKDIMRGGTWLKIRVDTEDIVVEIVEAILEELMVQGTTWEIQI